MEAVGANITQFQPGDDVFGWSTRECFSEYLSVSEEGVVAKQANFTFEELVFVLGAAFPTLQATSCLITITPVRGTFPLEVVVLASSEE